MSIYTNNFTNLLEIFNIFNLIVQSTEANYQTEVEKLYDYTDELLINAMAFVIETADNTYYSILTGRINRIHTENYNGYQDGDIVFSGGHYHSEEAWGFKTLGFEAGEEEETFFNNLRKLQILI